ncbi:MAG: GNAT family N-acetyltransferase [Proteobacteria bacterium]|nr:GNAT family N-acetyltransferase [Pseudomonadota bacterium]
MTTVRLPVSYLELTTAPALPPPVPPSGRGLAIAVERLGAADYLVLYRAVGEPLRWDSRLKLAPAVLAALLDSGRLAIFVLRDGSGRALGFCEFDRERFPEVELTHFGLVPEAQGRGLGPWLLGTALAAVWNTGARRLWLHTDPWDHPAALGVYARAGFVRYLVREQPVEDL